MSELKDGAQFLRLIHEAMSQAGIDTAAVYARCGVPQHFLEDPNRRTRHDGQVAFWAAVEEVSGDADIGLHLGAQLPPWRGHVLEYLFLSSATFGDGLARTVRYQRLLSDAAVTRIDKDEQGSYLSFDSREPTMQGLRHFFECFAQGLIRFFAEVTENAFWPTRVVFAHEAPENTAEHQEMFDCEVSFGGPECRLYFDSALLDLPSPHHEPRLLALHEQLANEELAALTRQDIVGDVRQVIAQVLELGTANLDTVAEKLGLASRELRSRLADAGTNFNQVLSDYRCTLAKQLLAGTDESIEEIVYLTGFSEPSTFYRAFRRWLDMTPLEYRAAKKSEKKT